MMDNYRQNASHELLAMVCASLFAFSLVGGIALVVWVLI